MIARAWTSFLLVLAGTLIVTAPAPALTPPPLPSAQVVFANGGRILTMNADGGGRKVIFGRERSPKNDGQGASEPVASPDGRTVAFAYSRRSGVDELLDIWTVGSDGKGAKRILTSTRRDRYGDPAFAPDGRLVVAFLSVRPGLTRSGLVSVGTGGGKTRTLLNLRQKRRPYRSPRVVMEPAVSRDGKRILYLLNEFAGGVVFDEGFENPLMVLNLASGKSHKVAEGAYEATFSPDGRRIAYSLQTSDDDLEVCWWDFGCRFTASLAVINTDGSGRRYLTGPRIDERSPDWSQDNRIVFQSARNLPQLGEASEIYSIRPDGSCLTMLTNGSPASLTPAWLNEWGGTAPSGCGVKPPEVTDEVRPLNPDGIRGQAFWLGSRPGTRILTAAETDGRSTSFSYLDCDRQWRKECEKPLLMWGSDICALKGRAAVVFSGPGPTGRERGALIFRDSGGEMGPYAYLVAGRSMVVIIGASGRGADFARLEVGQLRRLGASGPAGDLPSPRFPAFDIKQLKKVHRIYERTGSVRRTANRLGRGGRYVRANLRFARYFKAGSYKTVNCSPGR